MFKDTLDPQPPGSHLAPDVLSEKPARSHGAPARRSLGVCWVWEAAHVAWLVTDTRRLIASPALLSLYSLASANSLPSQSMVFLPGLSRQPPVATALPFGEVIGLGCDEMLHILVNHHCKPRGVYEKRGRAHFSGGSCPVLYLGMSPSA